MTAPRAVADGARPARAGERVGLAGAIVMGLSSSGPSQTLAVSLAALVAASGYAGVLPVLVCFVPMLGIAVAYRRLNRWDPSAGATYTWVARVFHPFLGFLSGWMILLYYTLGTTTLTIPAGIYTLALLAPAHIDDPLAIFLVGAGWNVLIGALAILGLKLVARVESGIVVFEYLVILGTASVALAALVAGSTAVHFSAQWFSWQGLGGMKGLMGGMLIAYFMYSGWDAAIYVNEETDDRRDHPGQAAVASVLLLALVYALATFAFQAVLPAAALQAHAGNALAAVGDRLLPRPWNAVMALAVLGGTLASLQAAVVSAARVGHAMARDGVMPRFFRLTRPGSSNPWAATLALSALNIVLLALALGTTGIGAALRNAASSLGLIAVVFYGLTAAAALWQSRAAWRTGAPGALLAALLPLLGMTFSVGVLIESLRSGAVERPVLAYGLGSIAVGACAALILRARHIEFFSAGSTHAAPARSRTLP